MRWRWVFTAAVLWSADWLAFVFLYLPLGWWVLAAAAAGGWLLAAVGPPLVRLPLVTVALVLGLWAAAMFPAVSR